jgi:protease I
MTAADRGRAGSPARATNNSPAAEASRTRLKGMRVIVLVAEGVEDLEYWVTVMRLREEGAQVTSVGATLDAAKGKNGLPVKAERLAADVDPEAVDGLVVPGGWAPDKLRRYETVTGLVRSVEKAGKPIGIICHGGLVAISAGIVREGRPATGSLGIRDDLVNVGARWVDEPAFRDGDLVWGRVVDDIPAFERELVALFAEHHHRRASPTSQPRAAGRPGHRAGAG